MTQFLLVLLLATGAVVLILGFRLWQLRRRHRAIQRFLDEADGLEADLQGTRERLQSLQRWVSTMPKHLTGEALKSLAQESAIKEALRHLLNQRIWLRDHSELAPIAKIESLAADTARARQGLAHQMERLEAVSAELAQVSAEGDPMSAVLADGFGVRPRTPDPAAPIGSG